MISKIAYLFFFFLLACQSDNTNDDKAAVVSEIYVTSINITGSDISAGVSSQMTAEITPADASNKTVIWKTSDPSIASISQGGLLTAYKNGTVTITAAAKDKGAVTQNKVITISGFASNTSYSVTNAAELLAAFSKVKPGESIIMNGGTYFMNSKLSITTSGTLDKPIRLIVKEGESRPKLDFSAMPESSSNQGIVLAAAYWHIKGIDIIKAGDNGMQVKGSNNIIEFCSFSECADTGLQIDSGGSNNTILNCDSYFNADSTLENADGFACKLTAGTGNKFIGCRAWQNLDDGWDGYLRGTDNISTTYENCWTVKNGYLKNGTKGLGDGNGFKTGGSDDKLLKHNAKYTNCIAAGNTADGFDHNSNRGEVIIYNCTAYANGKNYSFSSTNPLAKLTVKNSNTLGAFGSINAALVDTANNSWQNDIITTAADFKSTDFSELLASRKADGSLPDVNFFHLTAGSPLIDKGINVGLPFKGAAPDIGAFEY